MLAGMLTWTCAIFSYYAYYAILLSLGKLPHLEHLNVFGNKNEYFWTEYWNMFNRIIKGQFFEWIIIALIGGAIIGALAFWLIHKNPDPYPMNHNKDRNNLWYLFIVHLKIVFLILNPLYKKVGSETILY